MRSPMATALHNLRHFSGLEVRHDDWISQRVRKGGSNPMFLKTIAVAGFVVAISAAPAFALGSGRGHGDYNGGAVSGSFDAGTFAGQCNEGTCTGTYTYSASEPLAALAVGLGLLGARFLRRR